MKTLVIVNPQSRSGKTGRQRAGILAGLDGADHALTDCPGHAADLARGARRYDRLVAVGGDGTVCEVLRGMDRDQQLALVPAGTGNSLARDYGLRSIGRSLVKALDPGLPERRIDSLDVSFVDKQGRASQWLASSMVALGYVARCADIANRYLKGMGRFCYALAAAATAGYSNRQAVEISVDEGPWRTRVITSLLISNTRHIANFEAFPGARADDGLLDVLELDMGKIGQNVYNLSVLTRRHWYRPVEPYRARTIAFRPSAPRTLMIDGEILPDVIDVKVTVIPGGIRCCLPH